MLSRQEKNEILEACEILEIKPCCSVNEVEKAFRKQALLYHPDKNPSSEEKFKKITKARDLLLNSNIRTCLDHFPITDEMFDSDNRDIKIAVMEDNEVAVQQIINANKLDINKFLKIKEYDYPITLLELAVNYNSKKIIDILLKNGADCTRKYKIRFSPFMTAVYDGKKDIVQLFLKTNVNVNEATHDGITALMIAAQNRHADIVELLLESGAEVNCTANGNGGNGWSPLMFSAQNRVFNIVEILLKAGAKPELVGYEGDETPLMFSARMGRTEILEVLLDYGANTDAYKTYGIYNPLKMLNLPAESCAIIRNHAGQKKYSDFDIKQKKLNVSDSVSLFQTSSMFGFRYFRTTSDNTALTVGNKNNIKHKRF